MSSPTSLSHQPRNSNLFPSAVGPGEALGSPGTRLEPPLNLAQQIACTCPHPEEV